MSDLSKSIARATLCAAMLINMASASAHTPIPLDQTPPVKLRIKPNGAITWDGQVMSDLAFEKRLAALAQRRPHPKVYVLPNKHATYSRVAHLFEIMQRYSVDAGLVGYEQAE